MTLLDWLYSTLIVAVVFVDHFVFTPMFRRRSPVDPRRARQRLWSTFLLLLASLTALGVALWVYEGRAWEAIAVRAPTGWRAWGSVGLVLSVVLFEAGGASRVARSAERRKKIRDQVGQLGAIGTMVPRTRSEFPLWVTASLAAGIGEEFLFRGYLIWLFNHWLGWWLAGLVSLAVFSFGHSYQGTRGILNAALAGACMTVIVAMFDSLLPAMAVHALIDISSGYMAWLALRDDVVDLQPLRLGEAP